MPSELNTIVSILEADRQPSKYEQINRNHRWTFSRGDDTLVITNVVEREPVPVSHNGHLVASMIPYSTENTEFTLNGHDVRVPFRPDGLMVINPAHPEFNSERPRGVDDPLGFTKLAQSIRGFVLAASNA